MDPDLDNVIRQALGDAQAAGKDYLTQTEEAVRAARQARLDMAASQLPMAVSLDHTLAVARARVSGSNAGMDWMWP